MYEVLHENRFFSVINKNGHFVVTEKFECNGAVIAALTVDKKYILVEQLRKAIGAVSLEFPRGARDPGETMSVTALRELLEETGYTSGEAVELGDLHTNNSLIASHVKLFTCLNAKVETAETDGEVNRVVLYSPQELLNAVAGGLVTDSHTLSAITYLIARNIFE